MANTEVNKNARIGDALVEMGLISKDQLQVALIQKKHSDKRLGEILVELGFITEHALSAFLSDSSGYETFKLDSAIIDPDSIKYITRDEAVRYRIFPISFSDNNLRLAMADIYDVLVLDQIRRRLPSGANISPQVAGDKEINDAIDHYYGHELSIDGILKELEGEVKQGKNSDSSKSYQHPVIRLVNAVLHDAVKLKASDVHFEPEGNFLRIRYRIDGIMSQIRTIHKEHWSAISHRLKIMSGMNIADKLNPQDGRISLNVDNRQIDFRVSSIPTIHGENIVMRILDRNSMMVNINSLGFSDNHVTLLKELVKKPEGIFIVTGPTGSGKTTTLYALISHINSLDINVMTLEDPVEYEMSLVRQSQIRAGTNMNFAEGIRSMLRQDPDVMLVGEIRDADTASMALRAAMTGHQIYTTLHANDAVGAFPRLVDLGLKPSLMAGNIIGIVAQRLARKLCTSCKKNIKATSDECRIMGFDAKNPPEIAVACGCDECRGTGYSGRVAVAEILPLRMELNDLLIEDAPISKVRKVAHKYGYLPMAFDGRDKVLQKVISIDSLIKAVDINPLSDGEV